MSQSTGLNQTSGEISFELPTVGGMSQTEFTAYTITNVALFCVIFVLLCIYRMDCLHDISETRIQQRVAHAEYIHRLNVKKYGAAHMQELDR